MDGQNLEQQYDPTKIIGSLNVDQKTKADLWEDTHGAQNEAELQVKLQNYKIPNSAKADLWEWKKANKISAPSSDNQPPGTYTSPAEQYYRQQHPVQIGGGLDFKPTGLTANVGHGKGLQGIYNWITGKTYENTPSLLDDLSSYAKGVSEKRLNERSSQENYDAIQRNYEKQVERDSQEKDPDRRKFLLQLAKEERNARLGGVDSAIEQFAPNALQTGVRILKGTGTGENVGLGAAAAMVPPARLPIGLYFAATGAKSALKGKQEGETDADYLERVLLGGAQAAGGAALTGTTKGGKITSGSKQNILGARPTLQEHHEALASQLDTRGGKVDPMEISKNALPVMRNEAARQGVKPSQFKGRDGGKLGYEITDKAIESHQGEIESISKPFMNDKVDMRPIGKAIRSEITTEMRNDAPDVAQRIENEAANFDRNGTIQEVNDYRKRSNEDQQAYYRKGESQRIMSDAEVSASVKGANAARVLQQESIGNRAGVDPEYIHKLFTEEGNMIDVRNSLNKKYNETSKDQAEAVSKTGREKILGVKGKVALTSLPSRLTDFAAQKMFGLEPMDVFNLRMRKAFENLGDYQPYVRPPAPGGVSPVGPNRPMLPPAPQQQIQLGPSSLREPLQLPPPSTEETLLHEPENELPMQIRRAAKTSGRGKGGRFQRAFTSSPETPYDEQLLSQQGVLQRPVTNPAPDSVSQKRFDAILDDIRRAAGQRTSPDQPIPVKQSVFDHLTKAQDAEKAAASERRVQYPDLRSEIAKMGPEDIERGLFIDKVTGLPNEGAFNVAERHGKANAYAMSDADGLKAFNDKFGHEAGDALLKAKAEALREAGLEAYHKQGDEFLARGDSEGELKAKLENARRILRDVEFTVKTSDGETLTLKGVDFSYGTGKDLSQADAGLYAHKTAREAAGQRARGELRGITQVRPESNQVSEGATAQEEIGKKKDNSVDVNDPKQRAQVLKAAAEGKFRAQGTNEPAPTFFSKAQQVAEEKLPNRIIAGSVIPTLKNAGVTAEQMKWLDLDNFLKDKNMVSKQELMDYIKQNDIQVKETLLGGGVPTVKDVKNIKDWVRQNKGGLELADIMRDIEDAANGDSAAVGYLEISGIPENLIDPFRNTSGRGRGTKHSEYQVPGGKNYRELLLKLPPSKERIQLNEDDAIVPEGSEFYSQHFDEPNILAHVRFNDRVIDGKKTLFIEEVQSDWHQKGRKQGYGEFTGKVEPQGDGKFKIQWSDGTFSGGYGSENSAEEALPHRLAAKNADAVPDAPFKTNWHELAMKRMLRYAAENGYEKLAWTSGDIQNERYDLSKQIDTLRYERSPFTNEYSLYAEKNGEEVIKKENIPANKLDDYVGKDVANRIIKGEGNKPDSDEAKDAPMARYLTGLDLKVGGSGMKGFYDKILPDFMNKYGKKWGAKVEQSKILAHEPSEQSQGRRERLGLKQHKDNDYQDVHSIDITPSMKKDVIEKGQPISSNLPKGIPPKIRQMMGESA